MTGLLAVDLGLRTGLAFFDRAGRLQWYRSRNFGSQTRLRRAAAAILRETPEVSALVVEGGGSLAVGWQKEAGARGIPLHLISAEQWQADLLHDREQRDAVLAKAAADDLARQVIRWSAAANPTSLRHDAAEAILVGLWSVWQRGWLAELPDFLARRVGR